MLPKICSVLISVFSVTSLSPIFPQTSKRPWSSARGLMSASSSDSFLDSAWIYFAMVVGVTAGWLARPAETEDFAVCRMICDKSVVLITRRRSLSSSRPLAFVIAVMEVSLTRWNTKLLGLCWGTPLSFVSLACRNISLVLLSSWWGLNFCLLTG